MPKKEIVPISQIEPVSPVAVIPVVDIPAAPTPSLLPLPIVVPEAQKPTPVTVKALPIIKPKEVTPEKPVVTEISRPVRPAPPLSVTKPY